MNQTDQSFVRNPARLLHFYGGIRGLSRQDGLVTIVPTRRAGSVQFKSRSYSETYGEAQQATGAAIFGVEFLRILPEARLDRQWILKIMWKDSAGQTESDRWSSMRHNHSKSGNINKGFDCACVRSQLQSLEFAILQLSREYHDGLLYHIPRKNERPPTRAFSSIGTQGITLSAGGVFSEAVSAIDQIARFYSQHCLDGSDRSIDSLPRLRVHLAPTDDIFSPERLERMDSIYAIRNLFTHNAPLDALGFFDASLSQTRNEEVFQLSSWIPTRIPKPRDFRGQIARLATFGDWKAFGESLEGPRDILEFAVETAELVGQLAGEVRTRSGGDWSIPTIGPDDIISIERVFPSVR